MNARVPKLLRSYARSTGQSSSVVKREWNATPRNKRGEMRAAMESGLWAEELRGFRKTHNLLQKEACGFLAVPNDTWRNWESARRTPPHHVRCALRQLMKLYQPPA